AGGLENRAKALDQSQAIPPAQGGGQRPAATELQQRQSGAQAGGTAAGIVEAVTRTAQGDGAAPPAQATGPRRLTLELRGAQLLRDAALFDNAPVPLQLQVKERDGTLIASRSGLDGGGTATLPLATASPQVVAELALTLQTAWPQPTTTVLRRSASVPAASVKTTLRLDVVAQVQQQTQFISAGPNPPSDAEVAQVLARVAFDLRTVLKKPVVSTNAAGEFVARFPQLALLRLDALPD
ncbi:MAG: hypothetical protein ACK4PH_29635, partial [Aquincola tertiaricarbonis]